ncbi:MAG: hypothetical protein HYX92_09085 [Chloroflexi bacterium]|nr:hypothetical protein [Chloroflexota bacterium]
MSRRKDRERYQVRKSLDPGYQGFRGPEPKPETKPEVRTAVCSVCKRVKNVPADIPEDVDYVCAACREGGS